jgi:hypothetical protein
MTKWNYRRASGEVKVGSDIRGWSIRDKQRGIISCNKNHDSNYTNTFDHYNELSLCNIELSPHS